MVYGYARVSTHKQVLNRQIENIIRAYPDAKIFAEKFSGTTNERPQWQKLLNLATIGDTIVFDSISRMSRNANEGLNLYMQLYSRGIELVFLKEHYLDSYVYRKALSNNIDLVGNDIADIYIKATNEVLKVLATQQIEQAFNQSQKEVDDLKQRTREGMRVKNASQKISKARFGKHYETKKSKKIKEIILTKSKDFGGTLKDKEVIAMLNGQFSKVNKNGKKTDLSSTFYKYKRRLLEESGQISGQLQLK